jgi:hypothetical protein
MKYIYRKELPLFFADNDILVYRDVNELAVKFEDAYVYDLVILKFKSVERSTWRDLSHDNGMYLLDFIDYYNKKVNKNL